MSESNVTKPTQETKPSFTQGPWRVGDENWIYGPGSRLLAFVCRGEKRETHPDDPRFTRTVPTVDPRVVEADARLIAAAPDLLAALKTLVDAVESNDNRFDQGLSQYSDEMDAARAVIAKAEGR